ncbi:hypothetical protein [Chryseobacterium aquaticum]|uniref:hypothetical protein n=1 Tax=Chryseobacterium aquaticum TaxID=452084 RepID=UPI003F713B44
MEENEKFDSDFSNDKIPISEEFWNYMENYWHNNREFPESTEASLSKKADLVDGKVPSSQLPSYVDDVLEFDTFQNLPNTGEKGKIYLITNDNSQFRWSGSEYIQLNSDEFLMTTNTQQGVYGTKEFYTSGGSNNYTSTTLRIAGFTGNNAIIGFNSFGAGVGTVQFDGGDYFFTSDDISGRAKLIGGGFIKDGYSDNSVLLAGGGHKLLSDLETTHTHSYLLNDNYYQYQDVNNYLEAGKMKFIPSVMSASPNIFPTIHNANAIVSVSTWSDTSYGHDLGFSGNGNIYHRYKDTGGTYSWHKVLTDFNTDLSEFVASKIINGSYNANNLSTNSITYGYSVANAPTSASSHSFTTLNLDTADQNFKMQIGFDGDTNEMFSRTKSAGNWNDWVKYATTSQLSNYVAKSGDTMTGGLIVNSPDSIGSNNLGALPQNTKLFLANGNTLVANYGTVFWTEGTGDGYIQQQRADGAAIAYRLNLQPYGGQLFYGNNEVATVNQLFKNLLFVSDLNLISESGIYRQESPTSGFSYTTTLNLNSYDGRQQLTIERSGGGMKFRGTNTSSGNTNWSDWKDVIHSSNFSDYLNNSSQLNSKVTNLENVIGIGFSSGNADLPPYFYHPVNGYRFLATQSWVSSNYISTSHIANTITLTNIQQWNDTYSYGIRTNQQFTTTLNTGLLLADNYYGQDTGLVDGQEENFVAGKLNGSPYYFYGSNIGYYDGLNYNYEAGIITIGKEVTNDEDKVQITGDISVDALYYDNNDANLILNPLYDESGDVRDSRNAHIYIVTGNNVRLPIKPILGQRIEVFNNSDSTIGIEHDNVGTLFYLSAFKRITGIVYRRGFVFDEEAVVAKKYEI